MAGKVGIREEVREVEYCKHYLNGGGQCFGEWGAIVNSANVVYRTTVNQSALLAHGSGVSVKEFRDLELCRGRASSGLNDQRSSSQSLRKIRLIGELVVSV